MRILVLEDSTDPLRSAWPALRAAFSTDAGVLADTRSAGHFGSWDGSSPWAGRPDSIVWFQGNDYDFPVSAGAEHSLLTWVAQGTGLVRTEWGGWTSAFDPGASAAGNILPIIPTTNYSDGQGPWIATAPTHPIAQGVGVPWPGTHVGFGIFSARPGATVVFTGSGDGGSVAQGVPMVTTGLYDGGARLVHINHDLCFSQAADGGCDFDPNIGPLIRNAAIFAGHGL